MVTQTADMFRSGKEAVVTVLKVDEDLRPLTALKARTREVVGQVQRTGRPVVLTRCGKGGHGSALGGGV